MFGISANKFFDISDQYPKNSLVNYLSIGPSQFLQRQVKVYQMLSSYILYRAIENTANQNTGKPLYIRGSVFSMA